MLATDLIGLGESPSVARRAANAGTGPITMAAKGTSYATSGQLFCAQYLTYVNSTSGSNWIGLPAVGGDNGALLGDDFIIHNATGGTIQIAVPSGVTINIGGQSYLGSSSQTFSLTTLKTITCYAVNATTWFGLSG